MHSTCGSSPLAWRALRVASIVGFLFASLAAHAMPSPSEAAQEPTFETIRDTIVDYENRFPGHTMTLAEVIAGLPSDFRAGFVLMHNSESIQAADALAPRVLMFGDTAQTILAFNGTPSQIGYHRLEIASLNPHSEAVEFRSIEFPTGDTGSGQVTFTGVNPPQCMACRMSPPVTIWR